MTPEAIFLLGSSVPLPVWSNWRQVCKGRQNASCNGQFVSDKRAKDVRWLNILLQEGFAGARKIQLLQTGFTFLSPPPVSNVSCLFLHSRPCREQLGVHFSSHLLLASASLFSLKKWENLQGKTSLLFLAGSQGQNPMNCLSMEKRRTLWYVG